MSDIITAKTESPPLTTKQKSTDKPIQKSIQFFHHLHRASRPPQLAPAQRRRQTLNGRTC